MLRSMLQFALLFDGRGSAEQAAAALEVRGFDAELQPQRDPDAWLVSAIPRIPVRVNEVSDEMRKLAAKYGGEYVGHGGLLSVGTAPRLP
jgi:hypothetical protein